MKKIIITVVVLALLAWGMFGLARSSGSLLDREGELVKATIGKIDLPVNASGEAKDRTAVDNATIRSVFIIGPDKLIKLILTYPMSTGRNFDEVLRVLDSIQLTAKHKVATPVNWKSGEDVIIVPAVSDEDAKVKFPEGWNAPKPYLRIVKQPH